jgi:tape measure domain-containing protein
MAGVYYDARINGEQLQKDIAAINAKLNGLTGNVQKAGNEMDGVFNRLAGAMAGYFSLNFGAQFVTSIAKVRGEFQQLEVAFETMLDSKDKADKLMAQVVDFAAKTPFELKDVGDGAKSLLAFGVAAEDLMPTLKSLGDVAAGLSVPIDRLILNFGQIKTQGQLTGRELRDFAVAGVPLVATLSQTLNKSETDIQDMVSAGKIGFQEVSDAFKAMSSEGGRFANLMEKQSKTITGMQANLRDAWDQMLNDMGKNTEGLIGGSIQAATYLVQNYEKVIDILKVLVVTYGAYKAAVIAANVAMGSSQIPAAITNIMNLTKAIKAATTAQVALSTAQKATVIGLAVAGVAALVTAFAMFSKNQREAAKSMTEFKEALNDETEKLNKSFEAAKSANQWTMERKKAIDSLNQNYGQYLKNLLTEKSTLDEITEAQKNVTRAIAETIAARNKESQLKPYAEKLSEALENYNTTMAKVVKDLGNAEIGAFEGQIDTMLKNLTEKLKQGGNINIVEIQRSINQVYRNITGNDLGALQLQKLAIGVNNAAYAAKFLENATISLNEQTKAYLKTIGLTDDQIGVTGEQIKKTVQQQITETKRLITEANGQLKKLLSPESTATEDEIKSQQDIIKKLQEKLNTLTGFSKKTSDAYAKAEEERIKSAQELADKEIDIIRRTQTAKIAVMQEGADRQRAEAKLEYDQQVADIEKFAADYIAAINADTTLTTTQKQTKISFVNDQTTQQKAAVSQEYANKLVSIERHAALQISQLWKDVNEQYATDRERDLADVRGYYAEKIAAARQAKDEELALALEAAQKTAEGRVDTKYYIEKINLEEEVADRQIQISQGLFDGEVTIEKKRLNNAIKYAQLRIDYYTKLGKDQYRKEIEAEVSFLNALNAEVDPGISKGAQKVLGAYSDISNLVRTIDSDTAEWMDKMGGIAEKALMFNDALGKDDVLSKVTSGIGLATTVISAVIEAFKVLEISFSETYVKLHENVSQLLEDINSVVDAMKNMGNVDYSNSIDVLTKQTQLLANSAKNLNDKTKDVTYGSLWELGGINFLGNSLVGYFQELGPVIEELNKKLLTGVGNLSEQEKESMRETLATYNEIKVAINDIIMDLTGTSVDELSEAMVNAFLAGEDAAIEWGKTIDNIIKDIIIKQFTATLLTKPIENAMLDFVEWSKEGIQDFDIATFKNTLNSIFSGSQEAFKALAPIFEEFGIDLTNTAEKINDGSITGAIKGITEETAGLIAGQFMAMRENLLGVLNQSRTISDIMPSMSTYMMSINERLGFVGTDITAMRYTSEQIEQNGILQLAAVNESVTHLAQIEKNTRNNVKLNSIDARLEELNKNIKNL